MKRFLLFYDILQEKKINHIELKEQLKSIMDYVFRDEDINEVIRKINIDFKFTSCFAFFNLIENS